MRENCKAWQDTRLVCLRRAQLGKLRCCVHVKRCGHKSESLERFLTYTWWLSSQQGIGKDSSAILRLFSSEVPAGIKGAGQGKCQQDRYVPSRIPASSTARLAQWWTVRKFLQRQCCGPWKDRFWVAWQSRQCLPSFLWRDLLQLHTVPRLKGSHHERSALACLCGLSTPTPCSNDGTACHGQETTVEEIGWIGSDRSDRR